ncbi:MAG: hypothetical protein ACI91G_000317 [Gammaproteobacteria bacterium]|jgi:hypothetical protein
MKASNKAAAITLGGVLLLSGCSGSSDVNPYARIFGLNCSATGHAGDGITCVDGQLPDVLATVDEVLDSVNKLGDQLTGLTGLDALTGLLPVSDITDQLSAALEQATVAINEQLIGALPSEVSGAVDQALITAMVPGLTAVTNLISPALLMQNPESDDPLDAVRTALAAANNPLDILSAFRSIEQSLLGLQSSTRTSALVGLAGDLLAASSDVDDAPALLSGAITGVAGALASGDPAAVAAALEELTSVASADDVATLLDSVGGADDLINIDPEDLTGLGSDDIIEGIASTIGNLLGQG